LFHPTWLPSAEVTSFPVLNASSAFFSSTPLTVKSLSVLPSDTPWFHAALFDASVVEVKAAELVL
jgi:hypothetical protein